MTQAATVTWARASTLARYRAARAMMTPAEAMLDAWQHAARTHALSGMHADAIRANYAQRYLSIIIQRGASSNYWRNGRRAPLAPTEAGGRSSATGTLSASGEAL